MLRGEKVHGGSLGEAAESGPKPNQGMLLHFRVNHLAHCRITPAPGHPTAPVDRWSVFSLIGTNGSGKGRARTMAARCVASPGLRALNGPMESALISTGSSWSRRPSTRASRPNKSDFFLGMIPLFHEPDKLRDPRVSCLFDLAPTVPPSTPPQGIHQG